MSPLRGYKVSMMMMMMMMTMNEGTMGLMGQVLVLRDGCAA